MDLEQILKVKDNVSENWDDECYENKNYYERQNTKNHLSFKPYSCFYRYKYKNDSQTL